MYVLGQSLGYPAKLTKKASPAPTFLDKGLAPGAGLCPVPGENLVTSHFNQIRQKYY